MKTGHEDGTYICLTLSKASRLKIEKFCKRAMLKAPTFAEDLHVTIVYSKTPMPLTQDHKLKQNIVAKPTELEVWPDKDTQSLNNLVILLDSPELNILHEFYRKHYNASHDHPSFKPHVTLSNNYQEEVLNLEMFHTMVNNVVFDRMLVMPIDVN